MDVNKKRNVVVLLTLLFLAFFLPFSLSIIINEEKVTSQQSVAKLPPFSFSDEFPLTGQGNEVAIARTGKDLGDTAPPTLVTAQEALENKYPASFLSARNTNTTSKKLVAAESVIDSTTESLGEIFEGWSATGPLDAYTKYSISSFTREKDGTGSQMITAQATGVGISRHFTGLDPTKTYQAEAWVYTEKGGAKLSAIKFGSYSSNSVGSWVQMKSSVFSYKTEINLQISTEQQDSIIFVDGVSVIEITDGRQWENINNEKNKILEVKLDYDGSAKPSFNLNNFRILNGQAPKYFSPIESNYYVVTKDVNQKVLSKEKILILPQISEDRSHTVQSFQLPNSLTITLSYLPAMHTIHITDEKDFIIESEILDTSFYIDNPRDYHILGNSEITTHVTEDNPLESPTINVLNVAFISDGYGMNQMQQYRDAVSSARNYLLSMDPFSFRRNEMAFHSVENVSQNLGCREGVLGFECNWALAEATVNLSGVPHDKIVIVHNQPDVGWGSATIDGIIAAITSGYPGISTSHELGHLLGLEDEYVYSYPRQMLNRNCYSGSQPNPDWAVFGSDVEYFQGCMNSAPYRSSEDSMMNQNVEYFNAVSKRLLNGRISQYSGEPTPTLPPERNERTLRGRHFTTCSFNSIPSHRPDAYGYRIEIQHNVAGQWFDVTNSGSTYMAIGSDPNGRWELTDYFYSNQQYRVRFVLQGMTQSSTTIYPIEETPWYDLTFQGNNVCYDSRCIPMDNFDNSYWNFSYCSPFPTTTTAPGVLTPTRSVTPRPGTPTQVPTNTPTQPTPTPIDCVRAYGSSGYCQSQADCVRNIQMNQRPWTFNSNNTYCAQTPGQPINGCCYCTDLAGNPIPLCDGACNPYDPQCQGGGPPPPEDPPGCDSSQVTMSANPNPVTATNNVTLNISGNQGSTFPRDVFSGGLTNCGSWQGTWPKSKVCRAETPNTYTWTHYWKNCDNEACQNPSPECSKSLTYTINSNATATPTRTPTPACNKVAINNITVGPMNQLSASAIASQNHLSFTYQKISGSANPEKIVLSGVYNTSQNTGPINNFFNPTNNTYQYDVTNLWPNHSVNTVINKYKFDLVWPTGTNVCADSPNTVYSNVVTIPLYNPHGTARVQALNTTPTPYPASCRLFGWTRDQDADKRAPQGVPVSIHVYKNGTFNGGGQFLTSTTANIVRSDLPFGTGFQNHGYDINFYTALTPAALAELTGSTAIPLYVYAINSTGTAGGNTVISPLTTSGVSTLSIRCTPKGPTLTPTRTPTPTVSTCPPITNFSAGYTTCNPDHTAQARFTWTPVTSAIYSLQVSTDSNFTSPYTFPTFTVQPYLTNISSPANPRWYRMKVQSAPGCTVPGNWSPIVGPISRPGC